MTQWINKRRVLGLKTQPHLLNNQSLCPITKPPFDYDCLKCIMSYRNCLPWLIALQMHFFFLHEALLSAQGQPPGVCSVPWRELPAHHSLIPPAPASLCFIRMANYRRRRMWKRHPASRGMHRAHTFICTHVRRGIHGLRRALYDWREHASSEVHHHHRSIAAGQQNNSAFFAAVAGQW